MCVCVMVIVFGARLLAAAAAPPLRRAGSLCSPACKCARGTPTEREAISSIEHNIFHVSIVWCNTSFASPGRLSFASCPWPARALALFARLCSGAPAKARPPGAKSISWPDIVIAASAPACWRRSPGAGRRAALFAGWPLPWRRRRVGSLRAARRCEETIKARPLRHHPP
jgi:hypothetical protein